MSNRTDTLFPSTTLVRSNAKGLVEFSADFRILKPVDPARGSKRLFHDFGNRGNMRSLQFFNDAPGTNDPETLAHAGNGFFFRRGYTVVWRDRTSTRLNSSH